MLETIKNVGSIDLKEKLGISGHPGLDSDIYESPLFRAGTYEVSVTANDVGECKAIQIIEQSLVNQDTVLLDREIGRDYGNPGGLIIGDFDAIKELESYFNTIEKDDTQLWSAICDGLYETAIQEFILPISNIRKSFAFVASQGWFALTPLRFEGQICGCRIE